MSEPSQDKFVSTAPRKLGTLGTYCQYFRSFVLSSSSVVSFASLSTSCTRSFHIAFDWDWSKEHFQCWGLGWQGICQDSGSLCFTYKGEKNLEYRWPVAGPQSLFCFASYNQCCSFYHRFITRKSVKKGHSNIHINCIHCENVYNLSFLPLYNIATTYPWLNEI